MDRKEQELEMWKNWSTKKDPKELENLLTSMRPLLQVNVNKFRSAPIPQLSLEAQARKLAVKAFETYDPNKAQLNTHVTNHLKHLQRYVLEYQNIGKIPENRGLQISRYTNTRDVIQDKLGREPTFAEMSDALNWNVAEVERMDSELRSDLSMSEGKENVSFFDYTADQDDDLKDVIQFVWYDSDNIDKKILEYSFGMGGNQQLSKQEISAKLKLPESVIYKRARALAQKIEQLRYV